MTSMLSKRIVLGTMLACLVLPVIFLGSSPVDAVHGAGGPLNYAPGSTMTNNGILQ